MAILAECPICRKRQKVANKLCNCGQNLDAAKRSGRVKYWITYRLPNKKQRTEYIGTSIEEARASDGKRKAQKRETPKVLDVMLGDRLTFSEMSEWYLDLETVKDLVTYKRSVQCLNNFNATFGATRIIDLTLDDLKNYQKKRLREKMAPASVDMETNVAQIMLNRAYNNNKVSSEMIRPFKIIKKLLSSGENARKQLMPYADYEKLLETAPGYLRPIIIVGYNTGMRAGEIMALKWSRIDRKTGFIRLRKEDTKENKPKLIPINKNVARVLDEIVPILRSEYVFTRKGKRLPMLPPYFKTACRRAGLPFGRKVEGGYTFHDLRRSVKTNMLEAGVDKVYRDTLLGHSLKGMDVHYLQPSEENLKDAMKKYTDWLDEQKSKLVNVYQNVYQE